MIFLLGSLLPLVNPTLKFICINPKGTGQHSLSMVVPKASSYHQMVKVMSKAQPPRTENMNHLYMICHLEMMIFHGYERVNR